MHIETLGDGPDLVLLHGWAMHGGIFEPLTRRLRERFPPGSLPASGQAVIAAFREIAAETP